VLGPRQVVGGDRVVQGEPAPLVHRVVGVGGSVALFGALARRGAEGFGQRLGRRRGVVAPAEGEDLGAGVVAQGEARRAEHDAGRVGRRLARLGRRRRGLRGRRRARRFTGGGGCRRRGGIGGR